jgi:hypothetical protein
MSFYFPHCHTYEVKFIVSVFQHWDAMYIPTKMKRYVYGKNHIQCHIFGAQ